MAKTTPALFAKQVQQEARRVAWPTRRETLVSTAMVFAMVVLAAGFFFVVDQVLGLGVRTLLGIGV